MRQFAANLVLTRGGVPLTADERTTLAATLLRRYDHVTVTLSHDPGVTMLRIDADAAPSEVITAIRDAAVAARPDLADPDALIGIFISPAADSEDSL